MLTFFELYTFIPILITLTHVYDHRRVHLKKIMKLVFSSFKCGSIEHVCSSCYSQFCLYYPLHSSYFLYFLFEIQNKNYEKCLLGWICLNFTSVCSVCAAHPYWFWSFHCAKVNGCHFLSPEHVTPCDPLLPCLWLQIFPFSADWIR